MSKAEPGVKFVGRLASYKYFNMDQVAEVHDINIIILVQAILNALEFFDSEIQTMRWS